MVRVFPRVCGIPGSTQIHAVHGPVLTAPTIEKRLHPDGEPPTTSRYFSSRAAGRQPLVNLQARGDGTGVCPLCNAYTKPSEAIRGVHDHMKYSGVPQSCLNTGHSFKSPDKVFDDRLMIGLPISILSLYTGAT